MAQQLKRWKDALTQVETLFYVVEISARFCTWQSKEDLRQRSRVSGSLMRINIRVPVLLLIISVHVAVKLYLLVPQHPFMRSVLGRKYVPR
jgi:hypothetical protein